MRSNERKLRGSEPSTWLLVTGAPRSGTSLLRAMLMQHPSVALLQEYGLTALTQRLEAVVGRPAPASEDWDSPLDPSDAGFNAAWSFYRDRPARADVSRNGGDPLPEHLDALAAGLFRGMFPSKLIEVVGDKMPIGAGWAEDVPFLMQRLRGFRIITVIREPSATIRSSLIRREATRRGRDHWPVRSVQQAIAQWFAAWQRIAALQAEYGATVVKVMKYEELCARPQSSMNEVYGWLGLPGHRTTFAISALPPDLALHSRAEQDVIDASLGPVTQAWAAADAETLLAKFGTLAPPFLLGQPIRLASTEADPYLEHGFSFREEWGRWTVGPVATVRIPHGIERGCLLVEIGILQAIARNGECDVVVRCGSSEPRLFSLPATRSRIAMLASADGNDEPGILSIRLHILRPKHPEEAPPDERALGILVQTITLSEIGG